MFNEIKEFLNRYTDNLDTSIILSDFVTYDDKKLEIVLSSQGYMASVSILADYTYDFIAVEVENENLVMNKTKNFNGIEDLCKEFEEDIIEFSKLTK